MTKVFRAYTRKSVVKGETASPARQRETIERHIYAVYPSARIEWYGDLDISGRYEANRPGWQSLLSDLRSKGGDGVVVESIDRSHRNVKEFLAFYDNELAPAGRTLISATQNIDMATAQGRAVAQVYMAIAELESGIASERMVSHLSHLRNQGRFHGGTPFGCDRHPETKHLVPSQKAYLYNPATGEAIGMMNDERLFPTGETQAGTVSRENSSLDSSFIIHHSSLPFEIRYYHDSLRALFETYATGKYSLFDLAIHLNAGGWRSWGRDYRTPTEFQRFTTQSIITRWEIYAGRIPAAPGQRSSGVQRPRTIQAGHAPILPVELCEKAGAILRARVGSGGPKPAGFFLAGGVVYCGACGVKLTGYTGKGGSGKTLRYYRHGESKEACPERRARADDIHAEIMRMLGELMDSERLERLAAKLRQIGAERAAGDGGGEEIERLQAEMERLISLHLKDLVTEEEFTRHRAALQAEIERLKPSFYGQPMAEIEGYIAQLDGLLGRFREEGDHPMLQKEVIRGLFERIEIRDRRISRVILQPWCADLFGAVRWLDLGQGVGWRLLELLEPL